VNGILGVDWFILTDGADPTKSSFASMGLWGDVSKAKAPADATMTASGVAMLGMTKLLRGARVDVAATQALALPANVGGGVFVGKDGKHTWVLWARGTDEAATGSFAIPSAKALTMYAWDHAKTGAKQVLPSDGAKVAAALESAPRTFVE
jgi:hypothetical protein